MRHHQLPQPLPSVLIPTGGCEAEPNHAPCSSNTTCIHFTPWIAGHLLTLLFSVTIAQLLVVQTTSFWTDCRTLDEMHAASTALPMNGANLVRNGNTATTCHSILVSSIPWRETHPPGVFPIVKSAAIDVTTSYQAAYCGVTLKARVFAVFAVMQHHQQVASQHHAK